MNITLINEWGGAEIGVSLLIDESIGNDLINRGIAKESSTETIIEDKNLSAQKGATKKSSGKDDE